MTRFFRVDNELQSVYRVHETGETSMTMGQTIRSLRRKKELKVRQLAELLGKSPGYLSRIENDKEMPSSQLICALADLLDESPNQLLELAKTQLTERFVQEISEQQDAALRLHRSTK